MAVLDTNSLDIVERLAFPTEQVPVVGLVVHAATDSLYLIVGPYGRAASVGVMARR
jgi:hypothetical protein